MSRIHYSNNTVCQALSLASVTSPQDSDVNTNDVIPTVKVGSVQVSNLSMDETVKAILLLVQKSVKPHLVVTCNLDHMYQLELDSEFRAVYASATLVLADGMPLVWLSKLFRSNGSQAIKERVSGSDLMWRLAEASQRQGLRIFLLGGSPGSADCTQKVLESAYPGCEICGTYCPSIETFDTSEEQAEIIQQINSSRPDVLLVAFGAPKQEKWIAANLYKISACVSIGVGGSFEMACGMTKRAPKVWQRIGMEWAFRLLQNPKRLFTRYIRHDLVFLIRLVVMTCRESPDYIRWFRASKV